VATETRRRVVFVDLLRLLASFQMIQGHTLDALMRDELRQGEVFAWWSFIRGLTSVSFLFAAGLSFYLATLLDLGAHVRDGAAVRHRIRRGLWLVALGYLMHLPIGAHSWAEALRIGGIVDVLQCIGATLLTLEALALLLRRADRVAWAAGVLGLLSFALWPLTEPLGAVPGLATNWVSHASGSIFPVLPWAGHMLLGTAVARFALPSGATTSTRRVVMTLIGTGSFLLLAGWLGREEELPAVARLTQLGLVMLVCATLAWLSRHAARLPALLERLAGETLALYVFHVVLLYGAYVGLGALVGHRLGLSAGVLAVFVLCALSTAFALAWHGLKRRRRARSRR